MAHAEFDEPLQFLRWWYLYVRESFLPEILDHLAPIDTPIDTRQSSQGIDIERALARCIIALDRCHSPTQKDPVDIWPRRFMLQFLVIFFLVPRSSAIDEFIARVQESRLESPPSFSGVMAQVRNILSEQSSLEVQPLRVNGRHVSQPREERAREQSHDSVSVERLLESQLQEELQTGTDADVRASKTVNTPASATRPSLISLPFIRDEDSGGEDGEEQIPPSWAVSPVLHQLLKCQDNSLAKQIFGRPARRIRLIEFFPGARDSEDARLTEEEQFLDSVSPTPEPYAPYPDAIILNDAALPGAEQSHTSSSISESNASFPKPPSRFIASTPESPSLPENPPKKRGHFKPPDPAPNRVLRSAGKLAAPSKTTGIKGNARRLPRRQSLPRIKGKAPRRPETQKGVKPRPTQNVGITVSVNPSPDEMCRENVRSSFRRWFPQIAEYVTFRPPNERYRNCGEFYPYEVPLLDKSGLGLETKLRKVENMMQKLTDKFNYKAILPDQIFDDSMFNMAKDPGRTMSEVWERSCQQMVQTAKHSLVSKFLGFSVFIVNLSTKEPVYQAIYNGFSSSEKKFFNLANLLHALCCRLDPRWAGRHLSLVGHLLGVVGPTVLEGLFAASQPIGFYKLLEYLNSVPMEDSGNGMTAVKYVKIYLRDAEDSSEDIIMNALAQVRERPIERPPPTHGKDAYDSWLKYHFNQLQSYVTKEQQYQIKKRSYEDREGDQERGAKRPRCPDDSGYCEGDNSTGTDLSRAVELFANQVKNQRIVTKASDVRPFEVSCRGEDVQQLIPKARLGKDLANTIVGLTAQRALDHTVYLGIHKYESIERGEFKEITSQVEHIPKQGRWFLVIYHEMQYQSVRIDWEQSTISIYNPYYPYYRQGHSPSEVHVAKQHREVVYERMKEWIQFLSPTRERWAKNRLYGPLQDVKDTENSLLFNIWGLVQWLPGREFDGFMGDSIEYKRSFLDLIKSRGNWMRET